MKRVLLAWLFVAVLAPATSADPARYFEAGRRAYALGDFATAVEAFAQAYAAEPAPETAFSYAQALRRSYYVELDPELLGRAREAYTAYLHASPDGSRARHARQHLATIERLHARLSAKATDARPRTLILVTSEVSTATARLDGGPATHLPNVVEVSPGPHRVEVAAPGHDPVRLDVLAVEGRFVDVTGNPVARPATLRIKAPRGAMIAVDGVRLDATRTTVAGGRHVVSVRRLGFHPETREVVVPVDGDVTVDAVLVETARRRSARRLLWGSAGLAVATGISTVIALRAQTVALDRYDGLMARPPRSTIAAYHDAIDTRDTWRTIGIGLGAVGLAAGLTGLYLYYTEHDVLEVRRASPPLVPMIGPDAIGMAWNF